MSSAPQAQRLRLLGDDVVEIESVVIDPFAGYKSAVTELAPQAVRVADRFRIERLAAQSVTDVRRRQQQEMCGHRGREDDPLYLVRRDPIRARENLTERGRQRPEAAFGLDWNDELECAYTLNEMIRDFYTSVDRPESEAALAD